MVNLVHDHAKNLCDEGYLKPEIPWGRGFDVLSHGRQNIDLFRSLIKCGSGNDVLIGFDLIPFGNFLFIIHG